MGFTSPRNRTRLAQAQAIQLPIYQYDNGKGTFYVSVTGTSAIHTATGDTNALALQAGTKQQELVTYFVQESPRMELGYTAGPMSQRPGGDCTGPPLNPSVTKAAML